MGEGQSQKHPVPVADPPKVRTGRRLEIDARAKVGMGPPMHIVEQAGRPDAPQPRRPILAEERRDPVKARIAEPREPGGLRLHVPARLDQRVLAPQIAGHQFVKRALPKSIGRDRDPLGRKGLDQRPEHLRRVGDQFEPRLGGRGQRAQRLHRLL